MKYLNQICLVCIVAFFSACSPKHTLNINEIKTILLNENIVVAGVPQTYNSPVSVGLGVGGGLSSHVGIGLNTFFTPKFENNQDLRLQDSFYKNKVSISSLIGNEFKFQMKNDVIFKDKFVNFASDYTIYLYVSKYTLETATFSSKAQLKINIDMKVLDNNNKIIYENSKDNILFSHNYIYDKDEIFYSKDALVQTANLAIKQVVARLILEMKKDSKI